MAKLAEKNVIDYRQGGDTVDDLTQKYMKEMTRVYQFLNNIRTHNSTGTEQVEPEPYQFKAEDDKLYIRNAANDAWILLGSVSPNFGFFAVGSIILTTDDIATVTGQSGKLLLTNANGLLDADITGNAAKVAGKTVVTTDIQDGQVLTYRSATNTFVNEAKGAVGSGKLLTVKDGTNMVGTYSGEAEKTIDLGTTASIDAHNISESAHSSLLHLLQRSTAYAVGDIAHSVNIPSWSCLECITAGTTASTEPTMPTVENASVTDGTVTWQLQKVVSQGGANSPGYFSRDIPFYASDKLTIATPNRLWVNMAKKGYMLETQKTFDISADASWDSAATLWQANHDYAVNDVIYPATTKTGYYYRCTTAGKSSTLAPTFPTTLGATYNDGNVVWICELDFTVAANRKGKDFYIYSCIPANGTEPILVLSANSTVPLRYTADTSRKIGGFHTLCADVGTITGHTLSGYVAGNILPASVWDLKHRPVCSPEGMVFIDGMNVWMGIYFLSSSGTASNRRLATVYNGVIADGASSPTWNDFDFIETLGKQRMRLPSDDEFTVATQGNPQAVAISGAADPNTTGGHVSTSSVRLISNYGIEDGCGVMLTWCRGYLYTSAYVRSVVGGYWGDGASCGSRYLACNAVGALAAGCGARAASEPLAV